MSVLIPAYKAGFLRQAIASVLAQTFQDYELLISDDCLDGSVRAVVEEFGDARIRYLQGPRQGLVPNSALLFEQASCDLLKFVYDDDFLYPFGLARLVAVLRRFPDASFAFAERQVVNGSGKLVLSPKSTQERTLRAYESASVIGSIFRKLHNMIGEPSNILIRRSRSGGASSLSSYQGFRVRHLIDLAFYLNSLKCGGCVAVPEFHSAFRTHRDQASSKLNPAFSAGLFEWELFLRGEVSSGRLPPHGALPGLEILEDALYDERNIALFPEIAPFKEALPDLMGRLKTGERQVLDDGFRRNWDEAQSAIDVRLERAGSES